METKEKALLVAIICSVLFLLVGGFLFYQFKNIDLEGVACQSSPLRWAEVRLEEETNKQHYCTCEPLEQKKENDWLLE